MFEIEKKFKLSEGFEQRLREYGGKYLKKVIFTDTYYDNGEHLLTLSDYWLRCRQRGDEKKWELKVPLRRKGEQPGPIKIDKYEELDNEQKIIERLSLHPDVDRNYAKLQGMKLVAEAVDVLKLQTIAKFVTFREKYQVEGGFNIDLDKADFGYQLGEIEVLCRSKEDVDETTARILDLGKTLGVTLQDSVTGKVGTYLKQNDRDHYEHLVAAGVLVAET